MGSDKDRRLDNQLQRSDWAGDCGTRKSMLSGVVIIAGAAVASTARRSRLVCLSSCEAEVDTAVMTMKTAKDIAGLQAQLRAPPCQWSAARLPTTIPLYIDNRAAITAITSESRGRNRHFDIRLKFMCSEISVQDFVVGYIASAENPADGGTKALDRQVQAISALLLLWPSPQTMRN